MNSRRRTLPINGPPMKINPARWSGSSSPPDVRAMHITAYPAARVAQDSDWASRAQLLLQMGLMANANCARCYIP